MEKPKQSKTSDARGKAPKDTDDEQRAAEVFVANTHLYPVPVSEYKRPWSSYGSSTMLSNIQETTALGSDPFIGQHEGLVIVVEHVSVTVLLPADEWPLIYIGTRQDPPNNIVDVQHSLPTQIQGQYPPPTGIPMAKRPTMHIFNGPVRLYIRGTFTNLFCTVSRTPGPLGPPPFPSGPNCKFSFRATGYAFIVKLPIALAGEPVRTDEDS